MDVDCYQLPLHRTRRGGGGLSVITGWSPAMFIRNGRRLFHTLNHMSVCLFRA